MSNILSPDEDDVMLPPVLPGEELANLDAVDQAMLDEENDDEEDEEEEEEETPKKKKRGRKRKKSPREVVEKQKHSKEMDIDEWIADVDKQYGWDRPGVECQVHRIAPQWHKKTQVSGLVIKREGGVFDPAWIQEEFGGGEFEMQAVIPPDGPNRPPIKRKKKFYLAGSPKISDMAQPKSTDGAPVQSEESLNHPVVQRGLVGLVGQSQKELVDALRGGNNIDIEAIKGPYIQSMETMRESYEQRARAREEAAERAAQAAELKAQESKLEADVAKREMNRLAEESRQKIQEATQNSNTMLATLIPHFSDTSSKQVETITATFTAREAAIEQRHSQELDSQRRYHEAQIQQIQTLQSAEVARMEATFQSQLGLLQQQLQHFQQQANIYQSENLKLRDELMQLRITQIESLKTSQDPISKLGELQQLMEVAKDVIPGGGGSGDELGDDAPAWAKMINNAVNQLGPALAGVVQAKGGMNMPPQMTPLPYPTQMMPPQTMPSPQSPPGAMVHAPQEPKAPTTKLKKNDVMEMINIMGNVYKSGTTAERAAHAAKQALPHDVLRLLSKKDPEKVYEEFERAGLLENSPLLENDGKQFVIELLAQMRKSL